MSNKNNFRDPANQKKSDFVLYTIVRDEHIGTRLRQKKKLYYAHNTKRNPDALKRLEKIVDNHKNELQVAILYNNHTGAEITRWGRPNGSDTLVELERSVK